MENIEKRYTNQDIDIPEKLYKYILGLVREIYYLWSFIWQERLGEEALEFMEDHKGCETPFERIRIDASCCLKDAIGLFL